MYELRVFDVPDSSARYVHDLVLSQKKEHVRIWITKDGGLYQVKCNRYPDRIATVLLSTTLIEEAEDYGRALFGVLDKRHQCFFYNADGVCQNIIFY